jgi:hypothetical protein
MTSILRRGPQAPAGCPRGTHPEHEKWRRIAFHRDFTGGGLVARIAHTALAEELQTGVVPMPSPLALRGDGVHDGVPHKQARR